MPWSVRFESLPQHDCNTSSFYDLEDLPERQLFNYNIWDGTIEHGVVCCTEGEGRASTASSSRKHRQWYSGNTGKVAVLSKKALTSLKPQDSNKRGEPSQLTALKDRPEERNCRWDQGSLLQGHWCFQFWISGWIRNGMKFLINQVKGGEGWAAKPALHESSRDSLCSCLRQVSLIVRPIKCRVADLSVAFLSFSPFSLGTKGCFCLFKDLDWLGNGNLLDLRERVKYYFADFVRKERRPNEKNVFKRALPV